MNRRNVLQTLMAAPLAAAAVPARAADQPQSLWEKFFRTPLLLHDHTELPESGTFTYVAGHAETLAGIAEKFYADPSRARAIARWNDMQAGRRLHAGQEIKLVIPRLALLSALEVMQKTANGCTLETVGSDRRFQHDELFRLRVSPNGGGWLYAFNRDAGGRWKRLHPAAPEESAVMRFSDYVLPNHSGESAWFRLDRDKGDEELVLLFAVESIDELADILDVPLGEELKEKQENALDSLIEREEKAAKGITRVEGDNVKRETGAIIALGPDSGTPILVYRLRLLREA